MIAEYGIKYNGVWYQVGDEIAEEVDKNASSDTSDFMTPPAKNYTKTEINRMSTADLQDLAKMYGIDNAEEINGSELKKILITKFGL